MKKILTAMCTAFLFIAATSTKPSMAKKKIADTKKPSNFIVHQFHVNYYASD